MFVPNLVTSVHTVMGFGHYLCHCDITHVWVQPMDWATGLDYWTGLLDYWTGLLDWTTGLLDWTTRLLY